MGIVILGKARAIRNYIYRDFISPYEMPVTVDIEVPYTFTIHRDFAHSYTISAPFFDFNIVSSLRPFVPNDIHIPYTLDVLKAKNDVLSSYSIFVNSDTQSISSVRELLTNDTESSYLVLREVAQAIESEYDITTINKVHKDFLSVYILFDPTPEILESGFWVKLEGEV